MKKIKQENEKIIVEAKSKNVEVETETMDSDGEIPTGKSFYYLDEYLPGEDEYMEWKLRELFRLKRDRERADKLYKERENTERRRMMTEEERAAEDKKIGKYKKNDKSSYRFMQKYYHSGIFGDQNDPIFQRDYNIAVGEDNFDKTAFRSVKQKRRGEFGKKGQSKHTHLGDLDTTCFDPDWIPYQDIRSKLEKRGAGFKGANNLERPSYRRK